MDKLDQEIAEKRAEAQSLRDRLHVLEIEIGALERAAALRPNREGSSEQGAVQHRSVTVKEPEGGYSVDVIPAIVSPSTKRPWQPGKGRQPGAISAKWRDVLQQMHRAGQATVQELCEMTGSSEGTVRQRMLSYMTLHYVQPIGIDVYRVTETAKRRFGLTKGLFTDKHE